jgi:hypothetical protein
LYYYNNSASIGSLVYEEFKNNIANNETVTHSLRNFDEGDYSFDVECFDNSSNKAVSERDFSYESNGEIETISISDEEESDYESEISEIESLIAKINDFLVSEERYSKEEKEVVEHMGILDKARYYKKRLLQMKTDLQDNLGFNRDSSSKESIVLFGFDS